MEYLQKIIETFLEIISDRKVDGMAMLKKIGGGGGNHIEGNQAVLQLDKLSIDIAGEGNFIEIKNICNRQSDWKLTIYIMGNGNRIVLEDDIAIDESLSIYIEGNEHEIIIGEKSTFVATAISTADNSTKVIIGTDCMFSKGTIILASDFHPIISIDMNERTNPAKDIFIGKHVWVGMEAMVCKGSKIGANSIIGARALVTSEIPSYVVAAGMPACVLKSGMTWERNREEKQRVVFQEGLPVRETSIFYNLELFDSTLQERMIKGWITVKDINLAYSSIKLKILYHDDGRDDEIITNMYLYEREDIETYFKSSIYRLSGFKSYIPSFIKTIIRMVALVQYEKGMYEKTIYDIADDLKNL